MLDLLQSVLDWSEVWAILIPLAVIMIYRPGHKWRQPVIWYVVIATALNTLIDVVWMGRKMDQFYLDNNILYNIHSLVRMFCFSWFFILISQQKLIYKVVAVLFFFIALGLFAFFYSIFKFNSVVMALESAILLFYCLSYFVSLSRRQINISVTNPVMYIVMGLSLYTAINFPIFMFYDYLVVNNVAYAVSVWNIHNISYIVFCIFIALALKQRARGV